MVEYGTMMNGVECAEVYKRCIMQIKYPDLKLMVCDGVVTEGQG